jgi:hypothetical protein
MQTLDKYIVKIQVGVAIAFIVTIGVFVYGLAAHASVVESTEVRVTKIEDRLEILATKDDIQILKADLKDFINKK